MNTVALTEPILCDARLRRQSGQNLRTIAADVGVTWQKLDKALRHGLKSAPAVEEPPIAGGGYEPAHPWYYKLGGAVIPVEQIPAATLEVPHKLAKVRGTKRRELARQLLAEARQGLERDVARYQELIANGADALSVYDKTIAYGGDVEMALQGAHALVYHHIRYQRGMIAVLEREVDEAAELVLTPSSTAGPLVERYRPRALAALVGQERVVAYLRKFAAQPYPCALLLEGQTGTGKSSAALALAAELGCAVAQQELGGVSIIASGEQTADAVRETCAAMHYCPMFGSGWKVVIVNEADRMSPAAETVWLDRLESIPARTVVVFTTNHPDRLSQRFRDRCVRLAFESDAQVLLRSVRALLSAVWKAETGKMPDAPLIEKLAGQAVEDGQLSFRRAVQLLQPFITEGRPS